MNRHLPFPVIFEDRDIIVIDKPAGLLTTNTRLWGRRAREEQATAENILTNHVRKGQSKSSKKVWLVHRLDRETSGVMMFAKSPEVAEYFRSNWARLTEKTYLARVRGKMEAESGAYESYLKEDSDGYRVRSVPKSAKDAKYAKTEWRVLSAGRDFSLVEIKLHTGRKNQIRVHFAEAGHPVEGDEKYGGAKSRRLMLHSLELKINSPRWAKPFRSEITWT
ncbi:MAG: RNA pseudouridine synthase [Kiritimatiellae bacterium]|nr:RNA pseudouridine synthase [Kiritimatiellia bacterium]